MKKIFNFDITVNYNFLILPIIFFLLTFYFYSFIPTLEEISSTNEINFCKCVIFRLDDIQDYWINSGQIFVMNLFLSKNQSLSLGLIMNELGDDPKIINKINEGVNKGIFELGLHGWNHIDYTKLNKKEQKNSLTLANQKMERLFGKKSEIFIPPKNLFNDATVKAMDRINLNILSSSIDVEYNYNKGQSIFTTMEKEPDKEKNEIFHLPSTSSFKDEIDNKWIKSSITNIIENTTHNIDKYGYAVIVIHPQDFVKIVNGIFVNEMDYDEIQDLSNLINFLLAKNISITSFSKLVGINPKLE